MIKRETSLANYYYHFMAFYILSFYTWHHCNFKNYIAISKQITEQNICGSNCREADQDNAFMVHDSLLEKLTSS
jgi:hypothetical protein